MFKPIPGNNKYLISLDGVLKHKDSGKCTPPITTEFIDIEMYGQYRHVHLHWLACISHYEVNLPEKLRSCLKRIQFKTVGENPNEELLDNLIHFDIPIVVNRTFRVVPRFPKYAVSNNGIVITLDGKIVPLITPPENGNPKHKYYTANIYDPVYRSTRRIGVHRLVAWAWVPMPLYKGVNAKKHNEPWIVNHKDGNKLNVLHTNLEWVTYSENNKHAVRTGLIAEAIPCCIRNAHTGEVKKFPSAFELHKFLGNGVHNIKSFKHHTANKLLQGKWEFKQGEDDGNWFYAKYPVGTKAGRYTIYITDVNGERREYPDARTFKQVFHVWNVLNIEDMKTKFESIYPGQKFEYVDNYNKGGVQAYEYATGKIIEAKSISELARILNKNKDSVSSYLRGANCERFVRLDGYAYRMKSDKPWDTNFIVYQKPWCITATNTKTNEKRTFNSIREASRFFDFDQLSLKNRVDTNKLLFDWKLERES
jgi:hypothetical protein